MTARHPNAPAYRIETPRLIVRCYSPQDAWTFEKMITKNIEHLRPTMPWVEGEPLGFDDKVKKIRRFRSLFDSEADFIMGIFLPDDKTLIGGTGLHPRLEAGAHEIGYWIDVDHIGQGIATEAASALIRVGFEVEGLHRIAIHCGPENVRSARVPEKLGFTLEATLKKRHPPMPGKTERRDTMVWSMFAEDYPNSKARALPIKAYDIVGRTLISA